MDGAPVDERNMNQLGILLSQVGNGRTLDQHSGGAQGITFTRLLYINRIKALRTWFHVHFFPSLFFSPV